MTLRRLFPTLLLAAALLVTAAPAFAGEGDVIQIGHNIHIASGQELHDTVCIFCSIHVDANCKVNGDVVAIAGNIDLYGDAQDDVVSILGHVNAAVGSSIEEDVVSIFGGIHLGRSVTVGGDLVNIFGSSTLETGAAVAGDRVEQGRWVAIVPLLVLALLITLAVREYRIYRLRYGRRKQIG